MSEAAKFPLGSQEQSKLHSEAWQTALQAIEACPNDIDIWPSWLCRSAIEIVKIAGASNKITVDLAKTGLASMPEPSVRDDLYYALAQADPDALVELLDQLAKWCEKKGFARPIRDAEHPEWAGSNTLF